MANETPHRHRPAQASMQDELSSYGLDEIKYWIFTSREKFNAAKFRTALGAKDDKHCECILTSHDPKTTYGLQIAMWDEDREITISLVYSSVVSEKAKRQARHSEPYLEDFGDWLGRFFKYESTQGHMHGHFSYPLASRASKFPLPLKTSIEDAEIDGVSLKLPTTPQGVVRVRLTQGDEEWFVEVVADRKMVFRGFTPHSDVRALASVVNTLLEERKS